MNEAAPDAVEPAMTRQLVRLAFVVLVAVAPLTVGSAVTASCAPPTVRLDRNVASPGKTIVVTGSQWNDTCNDGQEIGVGACGKTTVEGVEPDRPTTGIEVEIRPRGSGPWRLLARGIAADDRFRIRAAVTLPGDLEPGEYLVLVHDGGNEGDPVPTLRVR